MGGVGEGDYVAPFGSFPVTIENTRDPRSYAFVCKWGSAGRESKERCGNIPEAS